MARAKGDCLFNWSRVAFAKVEVVNSRALMILIRDDWLKSILISLMFGMSSLEASWSAYLFTIIWITSSVVFWSTLSISSCFKSSSLSYGTKCVAIPHQTKFLPLIV